MKAAGIILAGGRNERLGDLTELRATSALPVGSCFRVIDFALSNMANSGFHKVAVITQFNSRSLNDHLSSSKWWDFGRKSGGLFTFTPFLTNNNSSWFRGTADSIFQNITFLKRSNEPYVVIAGGEGVYKMDYRDVLKYHVEKGADITVVCKDVGHMDVHDFGVLGLEDDMRICYFDEKPQEPRSSVISLGIYVISRNLLIQLLETIAAEDKHDFVRDILVRYMSSLKVFGYNFDGYWSTINTVSSYYNTNMDFLKRQLRDLFFKQSPYTLTKPKDEPPVKYNIGSNTKNCLIGSGSVLNGYAESSIMFRRVMTGENSFVKNSIVMEGCYIGNNCIIENAILDKEVVVTDGRQLSGAPGNPIIIKKGSLI